MLFTQLTEPFLIIVIIIEKMDSYESIAPDIYSCSISQQFLDISHYKQTHENNRKGALFYETLCYEFENYYKMILQIPAKCNLLLINNTHFQKWEIKKFKHFLKNLFQIFNLISEFQIEGLSTIRTSQGAQESLQFSFNSFISNIQKYSLDQENLQEKKSKYLEGFQSIQKKQDELKKKLKKPYNYYNIKLVNSELASFQQKLSQKYTLQSQISQFFVTIDQNNKEFEKDLIFFKQKLIMTKYEGIQKITRLCKNSKQSIIEIFTYLYEFIQNSKDMFAINKRQAHQNKFKQKLQRSKLSELIISQTNNHNLILDQYAKMINELINSLTAISVQIKQMKIKQIQFVQFINKYYQYNECDIAEVKIVLSLYNSFLKHMCDLGDKLVFSVNNITQLQKKVKKCSEMTLTLIKCSPEKKTSPTHSSKKQFFPQLPQQNQANKYLDILNEEMSNVYIQNILLKIYTDFKEAITKIRDQFLVAQPNKRKKIDNSMSISYITELNIPVQRKPSKKELWLWKNWKEELSKDFQFSQSIQILMNQLLSLSTLSKQEDRQLQSLYCIFRSKKINGILKLKQRCLLFQSNDSSFILFIPLNQVETVDMEIKMISKTLSIQTNMGPLNFIDQTQGGIKKFYANAQKSLDSYNEHNQEKPNEPEKKALSQQQIEFIKNRRIQIQKDLEPLNEYQNFATIILQDIDIVDVYRVCYSGNPVIIGGKEYQNFLASLSKKFKNLNATYGQFDHPGPMYYSGVQGSCFRNCPLYSQKVIEYDHMLPKIPLISDSLHNLQKVRVYWVSHQQFHVMEMNYTSKAPFAENFNLIGLLIIKQIASDVEVKIHFKLIEVHDFSLKKIIYPKAIEEFKKGCWILLDHMKKVMPKYKKKGDHQKADLKQIQEDSLGSEKTQIKQYKHTIKKLQGRNKKLLYILALVFVANLIFIFYF